VHNSLHTTNNTPKTIGRLGLTLTTCFLCQSSVLFAQNTKITPASPDHPLEQGPPVLVDNKFNPAISLIIDATLDWQEFSGAGQDGMELDLRRADLSISGWLDDDAFAWTTIAYEGDGLELDEAAIEYMGFPNHQTVRAGRFFIDFGQQMQAHVEELRTIDRPLVLREFHRG
jgi:hypothetical protein